MKYYRFLSEEVEINGSDKAETFSIFSVNDSLVVTVYGAEKQKLYQRSFSSSETYCITLNGYGGNDVFETDEKLRSRIRIIIHGGEGTDQYNLKGDARTKIHDTVADKNSIRNKEIVLSLIHI